MGEDEAWSACVALADDAVRRERGLGDGRYRRERLLRHRERGVSPATGEALVRMLIVLGVRAVAREGGAEGERALLVGAERALGGRPAHELFAALRATGADRARADALRLLLYSGSALTWERLVAEARQVIRRAVVERPR
ncbi:hypothetical protein [Streptomyces caatingaensis]|nr:hypothetical protein [Streptomyces caatingaensis]